MPEKEYKSCPSHCCARHGCKYGYEECPVETEKVEQDGPCEFCLSIDDIRQFLDYYQGEFIWWGILQERKQKREKEKNAR